MAYIVANRDGTSNGRPGDTVITGGGLVHIGADGSKTVTPLPGVGKTKNYDTLKEIANNLTKPSWLGGNSSSNSNSGGVPQATTGSTGSTGAPAERTVIRNIDDNGLIDVGVEGFNPYQYQTYASAGTSSSSGLNKIGGAIILGLIGLAILDRFVGGK